MQRKGFASGVLLIVAVAVVVLVSGVAYVRVTRQRAPGPAPVARPESPPRSVPRAQAPVPANQPFPTPVPPRNPARGCDDIRNAAFISVEQHEGGLGPDGPVMRFWRITLHESGQLQWDHSDVFETGTYSCSNNTLQAKFYDRAITARYDPNRAILTWEKVEYRKVN